MKCLLCSFTDSSPLKIEEHINKQHFDEDASLMLDDKNLGLLFECPLCSEEFKSASLLESHVNISHENILSSPEEKSRSKSERTCEKCPICASFDFCSAEELALHVELHFNDSVSSDYLAPEKLMREEEEKLKLEQEEFARLQAQYGMDNESNFKEQSIHNLQRAVNSGNLTVADYYDKQIDLRMAESCGVDDESSCLKDVMPLIRQKSENSTNVCRAYLCSDIDFYGASYGDRGWGCGYRNTQMLLSSLFREKKFHELLVQQLSSKFGVTKVSNEMVMPSISKLQQIIEWAWKQGFDERGCKQLGGKVFETRKWIGATEVVTLLSALRIRCQCVDVRESSANGLHPKMFNWILEYFQKPENFKPPLYLQHQGHSRTIVGVEILKDQEIILLTLDPGCDRKEMEKSLSCHSSSNSLKYIRKSIHSFKHKQYQIVAVVGTIDSEREYQANKVIENILTVL